ncbi:MAG: glycosyltransferase family 4 protein [Microcoleaceae cyanobacterium]
MKILHLSTSDIAGGAARAAYRLHQGLQSIDVASQMLVRAKSSVDRTVIRERSLLTKLGPPASDLPLKFYRNRPRTWFATQWFPDMLAQRVKQIDPDVIHLHWICTGFLRIETLAQFNRPIVWTLHDMWPFTGGCHYSADCERYQNACGACPQLKSYRDQDLSRWLWRRKHYAWQGLNLTVISPSHWLADVAKSSSVFKDFRVEVIPHGLDLNRYMPVAQETARHLLHLPQDKLLILFGVSPGTTGDSRKGFHLLQAALQKLSSSEWQERLELVVFGDSEPKTPIDLGFKTHYLGQFHDDLSLSLVYSAANLMVVPSVQEAFGQTASESLACGTPVVAFAATGLKDIIEHQYNGYLATPFEINDLVQGIIWVLDQSHQHHELRKRSREQAEKRFSLKVQADRHQALYKEMIRTE